MKRIIIQLALLFSLANLGNAQQYPPYLVYTMVDGQPVAATVSGTPLPGGQPPPFLCYGLNAQGQPAPCSFGNGSFNALTNDAISTSTGGVTTVVGLESVPFCAGYTPTAGEAVEYTTSSSPNPCYTAAPVGSITPSPQYELGIYPN